MHAMILSLDMLCVWCCVFQFALVETVTTSIMDQFPRTRKHKWAVILVVSIIGFLLGLTLCTNVSNIAHCKNSRAVEFVQRIWAHLYLNRELGILQRSSELRLGDKMA